MQSVFKNSDTFPEGVMHVSVCDIQDLRESFIQLCCTNIMSWVRGDWEMVSFHLLHNPGLLSGELFAM